MKSQKGAALIIALMFLSFLTILGGALLTTSTIDVWISDNYKTGAQTLYLAEAGIDQARETLRASVSTISQLLDTAAGTDNVISTSRDLTTLLASDDQPLIPSNNSLRTAGQPLTDGTGQTVGNYHVWLRNDIAEVMTTLTDTNNVLNLLVVATIGNGRKVIETTVKKGQFPKMPAALTLNGSPVTFDASNSNLFELDGNDAGSSPVNENAIGTINATDTANIAADIAGPPDRSSGYTGSGGTTPDTANISGEMDARLTTVSGLESIVASMAAAATDTYNPAYNASTNLGNMGSSSDYRVVVVNGNLTYGGTGYGTLIVRGDLTFSGNFSWTGLIVVIGQGKLYWNGGGNGSINGGMFLASTRNDNDRSVSNPIGTLRASRGPVIADFNGGGGNGIQYNTTAIESANQSFPYTIISYREY